MMEKDVIDFKDMKVNDLNNLIGNLKDRLTAPDTSEEELVKAHGLLKKAQQALEMQQAQQKDSFFQNKACGKAEDYYEVTGKIKNADLYGIYDKTQGGSLFGVGGIFQQFLSAPDPEKAAVGLMVNMFLYPFNFALRKMNEAEQRAANRLTEAQEKRAKHEATIEQAMGLTETDKKYIFYKDVIDYAGDVSKLAEAHRGEFAKRYGISFGKDGNATGVSKEQEEAIVRDMLTKNYQKLYGLNPSTKEINAWLKEYKNYQKLDLFRTFNEKQKSHVIGTGTPLDHSDENRESERQKAYAPNYGGPIHSGSWGATYNDYNFGGAPSVDQPQPNAFSTPDMPLPGGVPAQQYGGTRMPPQPLPPQNGNGQTPLTPYYSPVQQHEPCIPPQDGVKTEQKSQQPRQKMTLRDGFAFLQRSQETLQQIVKQVSSLATGLAELTKQTQENRDEIRNLRGELSSQQQNQPIRDNQGNTGRG